MEELGNAGRTVVFVSHALGSIAQLCDRAIWIDNGHMVGDGKPAEVIANYLHQTHSAGSERSWSEESAPGNDLAQILSIRARPHEEMPPGVVDVRRPIGIEIGATRFSVNPSPPCHLPRQTAPICAGVSPRSRNAPISRYCGNSQSVLGRHAAAPICAAFPW